MVAGRTVVAVKASVFDVQMHGAAGQQPTTSRRLEEPLR